MKIEVRYIVSFFPMILAVGVLYGTFNNKIEALEKEVSNIADMKTDVAIIKEKIIWMEEYMIKVLEDPMR